MMKELGRFEICIEYAGQKYGVYVPITDSEFVSVPVIDWDAVSDTLKAGVYDLLLILMGKREEPQNLALDEVERIESIMGKIFK